MASIMIVVDPSRVIIYGQEQLTNEQWATARCFREALEGSLIGGVAKDGELRARVVWRGLSNELEARAGFAAAMREFLSRPAHWRPAIVVSRALSTPTASWRGMTTASLGVAAVDHAPPVRRRWRNGQRSARPKRDHV